VGTRWWILLVYGLVAALSLSCSRLGWSPSHKDSAPDRDVPADSGFSDSGFSDYGPRDLLFDQRDGTADGRFSDAAVSDAAALDGAADSQPVDSQSVDSQSLDSQSLDSQSLDSQSLDSQSLDSQLVDSQPTLYTLTVEVCCTAEPVFTMVTSVPVGIRCFSQCSSQQPCSSITEGCTAQFPANTTILLSHGGGDFSSEAWTGPAVANCSGATCQVTLTQNSTVMLRLTKH
jgi:hypothetical protein